MGALEPRLVESRPLRHLLLAPERAAGAGDPLPVLCFLHGYDEGAPAEIRRALTRHGPLRAESRTAARDRFIVVAPQLPRMGDIWHRHADAVCELVTEVRRAHEGDPARTYLTGFSFGGNGVFDLALARPDLWAALWAVDPTRPPRGRLPRPVWLSVGQAARPRGAAFARALDLRAATASPDTFAGDRVFLDEGADHVGSAALAYRDERIYAWLLAKRLPDDALTRR